MSAGLLSGWKRPLTPQFNRPLGGQAGFTTVNRSPVGRLVYHQTLGAYAACITDATALTGDQVWTLTRDVSGEVGIPVDGSVVGLEVYVLARCDAVQVSSLLSVTDYHDSGIVLGAAVSAGGSAREMYFGKVAGHYDSMYIPIVYTGGLNNTQFKWCCNWVGGTVTLYVRAIGYYTRADE